MGHAFNIRLKDSALHGYAQKYCFLNGPNAELNRLLLTTLSASTVQLSEERDSHRMTFLNSDEQGRIEDELFGDLNVPDELGIRSKRQQLIRSLGWKVAAIPRHAKDVLVLGSSTCREAILIRHWLPKARIVCVDFEDARLPNIEQLLDVRFHQADFNSVLEDSPSAFDVVFSNHVLEHLFEPQRTLRLAKQALRTDGALVSALPLDGQPSTPFSDVLDSQELHPLDLCTVDVAHAWKTNVSELLSTLYAAGFSSTEFRGRDKYFSVADRQFTDRKAFDRRARRGLLLNRMLFGSTRAALKLVFRRDVPRAVSRLVFGTEHRVWFGSNRLKNDFSIECLLVAR